MFQPEILANTAPAGSRPFAYVSQQPLSETPAGCAGLTVGDALLSLGSARHLRDVQNELIQNIGRTIPVLCIDARGRYLRKQLIPRTWDALAVRLR